MRLAVVSIVAATIAAATARATTLDTLIATQGTIIEGNLVFSNFGTSASTDPATVEVAAFTATGGDVGLRFSAIPAGSQFAQSTDRGGTRELVVDVTFTVAVNGSLRLIHGVKQSLDPNTVASGNGIVRNLTTTLFGPPDVSLFSCVQGLAFPGSGCPSPVDSKVLNANASTLNVDREIQLIVGQKGGSSTTGSTSLGFFEITFTEPAVNHRRHAVGRH
ncbi:MAG TPA: hypothetical protein VF980_14390 [Thermoanaerobaculia bacterium]